MTNPRLWPVGSSVETSPSVGPGSVLVLAANASRADADIVNNGATVVYLARGSAAVLNNGPRLNPRGGSYHIGTNNLFLGDVYGISSDECNLSVSEGSK